MKKLSINLYQDELKVAKPLLTLPRVVAAWVGLLVIMLAWSAITAHQISSELATLAQVNAVKQQQKDRIKELEKRVSNNKASANLVRELDKLSFVIANKQQLLQQLTNKETTYTTGYSKAMSQLASLHHKDISLTGVNIERTSMTFSGVARSPEAIPSWLARFEGATFLKGQSFNYVNLQESEDKYTQFVVSSREGIQRGTLK